MLEALFSITIMISVKEGSITKIMVPVDLYTRILGKHVEPPIRTFWSMMSAAFVYICKQKRNFHMDRLSLKKYIWTWVYAYI